MFWVHAQDFVDAIVGPFVNEQLATDHVMFCHNRGDSSKFVVVTDKVKRRIVKETGCTIWSIEDDLNWNPLDE